MQCDICGKKAEPRVHNDFSVAWLCPTHDHVVYWNPLGPATIKREVEAARRGTGPQTQTFLDEWLEEWGDCFRENSYPRQNPLIFNVCWSEFEAQRSDARFCSNACRQAAYRARVNT